MSEVVVTALVSLCVLGGALLGMFLNRVLPPEHVSEDTRKVVNVAVGLIATLSALVLGLMVAAAKSDFDTRSDQVKQSAARVIMLDRALRQYGPEATSARDMLLDIARRRMVLTWGESQNPALFDTLQQQNQGIESFQKALHQLKPEDASQRWLQSRALTLADELEQTRWLFLESTASSIQRPFLIVLALWLAVIFTSLGLFAPRNKTAISVIVVCAFSVSTAVFLILEMDQPFDGLMQISDLPLRHAFKHIEK